MSVTRLYSADDKINECGAVGGIRTDRRNQGLGESLLKYQFVHHKVTQGASFII
jgi:hypothetical protein